MFHLDIIIFLQNARLSVDLSYGDIGEFFSDTLQYLHQLNSGSKV